jgi:hypothetical protein
LSRKISLIVYFFTILLLATSYLYLRSVFMF